MSSYNLQNAIYVNPEFVHLFHELFRVLPNPLICRARLGRAAGFRRRSLAVSTEMKWQKSLGHRIWLLKNYPVFSHANLIRTGTTSPKHLAHDDMSISCLLLTQSTCICSEKPTFYGKLKANNAYLAITSLITRQVLHIIGWNFRERSTNYPWVDCRKPHVNIFSATDTVQVDVITTVRCFRKKTWLIHTLQLLLRLLGKYCL